MTVTRFTGFAALLAVVCFTPSLTLAAPIVIDSIGDYGWQSLDTRNAAGTNLVAPADNVAIQSRVLFDADPNTATPALNLITDTNSSKASLGVNGNFGQTTQLTSAGFSAQYRWMIDGPTSRISPLKFGIQSSLYPTRVLPATRTNEGQWDYVLVNNPTSPAFDAWGVENLTANAGTWLVYRSSIAGGGALVATADTLASLAASSDPELQAIFSASSRIATIEFGLGSGQANASNFIDYFQTSVYNGGDLVQFGAIPEPASAGLAGLAALGLFVVRRRHAQA